MGGPCVWGCFGVVLSSGINLIIVVTGVMTRCQRGYELRDALSTTNTWGLASEQHTAARGGDVKNEGYEGDERQSRGTEEQGSIIHGPAVHGGRVAYHRQSLWRSGELPLRRWRQ